MTNAAYDIFKRDAFGSRSWVEGARDIDAANRRIMQLSADSPGKYVIVSRASGQMVGGGTTITSSGEPTPGRSASMPEIAKASNSRPSSSHTVPSSADTQPESETLWR